MTEAEEKARLERAREQFEKWGNAKGAHIELSWSGEDYENCLVESAWQGWQARSDFTLSEMEAANKRIAELETQIKERDKCSFKGPMRDCPTHGETSKVQAAVSEREREIAAHLNLIADACDSATLAKILHDYAIGLSTER